MINLFVAPVTDSQGQRTTLVSSQGYNICRWSAHGLDYFAVSDINADELREFVEKFDRAAA